ncbi:MAG TPA: hypothetical protein VGH27_11475 [Streptosporangiaceae bacterium]
MNVTPQAQERPLRDIHPAARRRPPPAARRRSPLAAARRDRRPP